MADALVDASAVQHDELILPVMVEIERLDGVPAAGLGRGDATGIERPAPPARDEQPVGHVPADHAPLEDVEVEVAITVRVAGRQSVPVAQRKLQDDSEPVRGSLD